MGRIACILVADFPLAATVRANPELREQPLAVSRAQGPRAELDYVSQPAARMGVRPGMTAAQAMAIVSDLTVVPHSPAAERSAADALIDVAESLSPIVEESAPGLVFVDLAGLAKLHGAEDEIAAELWRRVRRVGLEAAIGIAASKEVAHLAARCGGRRVIQSGMEREFLNWLPLDLLEIRVEIQQTIARWGIRRLGELARLDLREVGTRLGSWGVELVRVARGERSSPLVPRPQAESFAEKIELEYGIELLEPLGFVMRAMLERLIARLELRGMVAGDILLSLELADRRRDQRRVAVAAPSNEVRSLLTLITLALEAMPPAAAIEAISIAISPRAPRPAQADMFLPPAPAPDRLHTTLARLAALCDPERVGALVPDNSHRPEAIRRENFSPPPPKPSAATNGAAQHAITMVLRAIRPAQEVEVLCARGIPEFVRGLSIAARVVSIAGPWRRQGEWWKTRGGMSAAISPSPQPSPWKGEGVRKEPPLFKGAGVRTEASLWKGARTETTSYGEEISTERNGGRETGSFARDYYDLALSDGGVYRMYCDLRSAQWFVDGMYD
jgi:protein ImuB